MGKITENFKNIDYFKSLKKWSIEINSIFSIIQFDIADQPPPHLWNFSKKF